MYIQAQESCIIYAYWLTKLNVQGITKIFEQLMVLYIQLIEKLALHLVYWGMIQSGQML